MARIRTIKPEFWSSPSMRGASPWARLLYIAMWNWADDAGRGTANVRELAAFAFPDDEDDLVPTAAELPSLLTEVQSRWSVVFYEANGRRYYAIPSWDEHQRNERKAKSKYPAPEEGKPYNPGPPEQQKRESTLDSGGTSDDKHGRSARMHGRSGTGTGEQGNRGTSAPNGAGAVAPDETSAQAIVAEWIERCRKRPPGNVIGQIGKHVKAMLGEGIDPDDIRRGLAAWMSKDLAPGTLPSLVNSAMNQQRQNVAPTDAKIASFLGAEPPHLKALPGGAS